MQQERAGLALAALSSHAGVAVQRQGVHGERRVQLRHGLPAARLGGEHDGLHEPHVRDGVARASSRRVSVQHHLAATRRCALTLERLGGGAGRGGRQLPRPLGARHAEEFQRLQCRDRGRATCGGTGQLATGTAQRRALCA